MGADQRLPAFNFNRICSLYIQSLLDKHCQQSVETVPHCRSTEMRSDRPKLVSWRQETRATRLSISMTPHRKQEVACFFLKKKRKKSLVCSGSLFKGNCSNRIHERKRSKQVGIGHKFNIIFCIIDVSCHKYHFCRIVCLSGPKYVLCRIRIICK